MTRVLVVDDLQRNRYLLTSLLVGNGYEVFEASNGAEALEHARRERPDVVVSDLLMPVMDGFSLLAEWKGDPVLRSVPFVVYTATYTDARDERLARDLGADEFLLKPAEPEAFLERLRSVLDDARQGALSPPRTSRSGPAAAMKAYSEVLVNKLESKARRLDDANRRLAQRERLYRMLFLSNPHPMWVYDLETLRFLAVNDAAVEKYGYSRDEFLGMTIADIRPAEDVPRLLANVASVADAKFDRAGMWRHRRRDGALIDVEITSHVVDYLGQRAEVVVSHDITARLQSERALAKRNRLYAMLSNINELLIRATDRQVFLEGVCRAAVEHGGFRFVWLGMTDDAGSVAPVARAGDDAGYIDALQLHLEGPGEQTRGPTVRSICSGRHVVSNDFLSDPDTRHWHDAAARAGFRASGAFPLRSNGRVVGSLNLYAAEANYFGEDEFQTLDEVADDISFGLEVLDRQRELKAAACVVEASPVVLFHWRAEPGWPVEFVSSNVRRWGYEREEFTERGRPFGGLVHPDDVATVFEEARGHLLAGRAGWVQVFRLLDASGGVRWVESAISVADATAARLLAAVTDVTERELAARASRASEQTLRQMMDTLHVGVWLIDASGTIVLGNHAGQRIWAGARYVGVEQFGEYKGWWAETGEPIGPHDWAAARAVEKGEVSIDEVVDIECFDGTRKTILNSAVPLRDDDGHIRGAIIVNHDITERRAAEIALAASEQRFHATFDQAAVGVAHVAPDGQFLEVNHRLCEIVDYSADELLGMRSQDVTHPDDLDRDVALAGQVLTGDRRTYSLEKRYLRKDGAIVWVNLTVSLVRKGDGTPDHFVSVVEDITSRHRAEDELRKLSLAIEQATESFVITDAAGCIEYVNRSFSAVSGYEREEALGRNPRLLQSGRTPRATYEQMWTALSAGQPWRGEFINRRKDGSEFIEAVNISPVRQPDGCVSHYVAVKEDVTERRRNELELERYRHELERLVQERTAQLDQAVAEANAANAAKGEFLANMSHEIRTPMNGVLGMLEILERGPLSRQQADLVQVARESGRTLLGIIDDILDLSKIEAGRMRIETEEVDLVDLAEGLCESLLPVATRKGVELAVFVDPALPARVLADPLRLRQILFNLLGNGIKFSAGRAEAGGRVRLRVVPGRSRGDGVPAVEFEICDNGIGMSEEELTRLFRPFTQAEGTTTRRFGGTGLGLTICRRLTELMGGRIAVTSRRGEGATFTVTLPLTEAPVQSARDRLVLDGIECVLIESSGLDEATLAAYLENAGARVTRRRPGQAEPGSRLPQGTVEIRRADWLHTSKVDRECWPRPCVLITAGRRRRLRMDLPDVVTLDTAALRRDELLRAVAVAAGRHAPERWQAADTPVVADNPSPLTPDEARAKGELILVAEDDEVNRKVIDRQLGLLGRTAEFAQDGVEALRMWEHPGGYALLLTDLHMPRLDGYSLTRAIRALEADRGTPAVPILALTANAMRGEAERAREIGMNEYLVKPLQLDDLRRALGRWLKAAPVAGPNPPVFDPSVLHSFVGNNRQALRELLVIYRDAVTRHRGDFRVACEAGQPGVAAQIAHRLQSSSRSVGALALGRLCEEVERTGRSGDIAALRARADEFDRAAAAAVDAVEAWLAGQETS